MPAAALVSTSRSRAPAAYCETQLLTTCPLDVERDLVNFLYFVPEFQGNFAGLIRWWLRRAVNKQRGGVFFLRRMPRKKLLVVGYRIGCRERTRATDWELETV